MRPLERLRTALRLPWRQRSSAAGVEEQENLPKPLHFALEAWHLEPATDLLLYTAGWCVVPERIEPLVLRLLADQHPLAEVTCGLQREDIARAFGVAQGVLECGFAVRVALPSEANVVRLETVDGRVLKEEAVASLRAAAVRWAVEAFELEPLGARAQLRAAGWCFAPGERMTLRLTADGVLLQEILCEQERADIAEAFGVPGLTLECGFTVRVALPSETNVVRLETVGGRVLKEEAVASLRAAAVRYGLEAFRLENVGVQERLRVEGWCVVPGRLEPVTLRLLVDDEVLQEIRCSKQRTDIVRSFVSPHAADVGRMPECGFAARIRIPEGVRTLRLETVPEGCVLVEESLDTLRTATLRYEVEAFRLEPFAEGERLRVEGWCIAPHPRPVSLHLLADDRLLRILRCGRERGDVVAACGLGEEAEASALAGCGFLAHIVVPAGVRALRLQSPEYGILLVERTVASLYAYRARVEAFRIEESVAPGKGPTLVCEGWLYPRESPAPARVSLYADDTMVAALDCVIERRDVEQAFIHLERQDATPLPRCGFRARIPLPPGDVLHLAAPDGTVLAVRERGSGLGEKPSAAMSAPQSRWAAHVDNNRIQSHLRELLVEAAKEFARQPLFAIPIELSDHSDLAALGVTVLSLSEQVYPHWELSVAAPAGVRERVRDSLAAAVGNERVQIATGEQLTDAVAASRGQWLCVLAPGDRLAPHALFEAARALQEQDVDLLYGDEDVLDADGHRHDPVFKPEWSPTRLLSQGYVGRPAFVRRATLEAAGGFRGGEHALWLRLGDVVVRHLPGILCHRVSGPPPDPVAVVAAHLAHIRSRRFVTPGLGGVAVVDGPDEGPSVEIVIPTRNQGDLLRRCVRSLEITSYRPFRVTVVDDRSDDPETLVVLEELAAGGVRVLRADDPEGFSFARLNNRAVAGSEAELLLLLNNDTEVCDPRWLSRMVALLTPGVGAVGARLLYPDGTVQHGGVQLWVNGLAPGHELVGWPADIPSPGGLGEVGREVAAVTAACLLTPRSTWSDVGGLDETFRVSLNDVDYCLRLADRGLRTVYAGGAELLHHESASRGRVQDPAELCAFRVRHRRRHDPYHNPNLDDALPTPECRLDFAAFKKTPLRVAIPGRTWEAAVVREALALSSRQIEVVTDGAEVVVAAGRLGYHDLNAAAEAGRPTLWFHGGPLEMMWGQRRPRTAEAAYQRALQRATWVVFASAEARERSLPWQVRENFVFNRVAVPFPQCDGFSDQGGAEPCRVVWVGGGDADSDPWTFVRAVHRLGHVALQVSWLWWGEPDAAVVTRALDLDRRAGRLSGRSLGPPTAATLSSFEGVDLFVSTGTGHDDPRPLLHATARGAAILAPYECGLGERAWVGINASTYPASDARALAVRLGMLVADTPLRQALGRRSRDVFGCLWSYESMVQRWADLVWGAWHMGSGA